MRPYRGLGAINTTWGKNWNGYDSIQMSLNRRFRDGVQATLNYTRSLRTIGNTSAQLRLQHNPDGSFQVRDDQEQLEELLRDTGNRPHVIRANFVWELPGIPTGSTVGKVAGAVINDWQLSGVFTGTSGSRYDSTFSYNSNGSSVNLTGSPSYAARIKVVGDPGSGCSDDQYAQFNTAAFAGPGYNSLGLESGSNLMGGCFETNHGPVDCPQHSSRRRPADSASRRHVQCVQHGRHRRPSESASIEFARRTTRFATISSLRTGR